MFPPHPLRISGLPVSHLVLVSCRSAEVARPRAESRSPTPRPRRQAPHCSACRGERAGPSRGAAGSCRPDLRIARQGPGQRRKARGGGPRSEGELTKELTAPARASRPRKPALTGATPSSSYKGDFPPRANGLSPMEPANDPPPPVRTLPRESARFYTPVGSRYVF